MSVLASLLFASAITAHAQPYPQKQSIKAIVPYGVGQATDVMCRVFLDRMRVGLKQIIVVENKPGAGGNIGASRPPGRCRTATRCSALETQRTSRIRSCTTLPASTREDLVPVAVVAGTGYVMLVNNKYKGKSLADIIEMAKAAPRPMTIGVASATAHVLYGMFTDATKVQLVRVPYAAGNATLFTDLMRGDVDLVIEAMPSAMAPINNGQVTPIAVTNPKRTSFLPDVPTSRKAEWM